MEMMFVDTLDMSMFLADLRQMHFQMDTKQTHTVLQVWEQIISNLLLIIITSDPVDLVQE